MAAMTSWFRRAGQGVTRILKSAADPGAEADRVVGYAKDVGGVAQLFARSPDFARQMSGTGCNIFDKPLVPHALDDEFDSTTLDPSWRWDSATVPTQDPDSFDPYGNPGNYFALHTQRRPSWLMFQANTELVLSKDISSIAGGDFFAWTRASFNARAGVSPVNNDQTVRIDIGGAVYNTSNRVSLLLNESDNGTVQAEFVMLVAGVITSAGTTRNMFSAQLGAQPIEAAGIQKIGTTYHGWVFARNGTAIWIGALTYAAAAPRFYIVPLNTSTAAPGTMITGYDFVRFKEGSTWLP